MWWEKDETHGPDHLAQPALHQIAPNSRPPRRTRAHASYPPLPARPAHEAELRTALKALGIPAHKLLRHGEAPYKDLDLATADEATVIAAMAAHPILIERPVVFLGTKAALGRPPEDVLTIL